MKKDKMQKILAELMYKDTATIRRKMPVKDGNIDKFTSQIVYENIPCKLSQYGKELQTSKKAREYAVKVDLRLCLSSEYVIQPNDVVKVQHQGREYLLYAAEPFVYPTHQEISLRRESEA